jgi:hypothetical protein
MVLAVGFGLVLALSVPYLIKGWESLAERAALNLIYSPRDIERRAYEAGQRLAKRTRGMSNTQLEQSFDRYIKAKKVDVPSQQLSVGRSAFIRGYNKAK